MAEFSQHVQSFRYYQPFPEMDMQMEMMKQFAELNPSLWENFSLAGCSVLDQQQQQPEFAASCIHENLQSTFSTTGLSTVPVARTMTVTSIEDHFLQSRKRKVMEQSTSSSQILSSTASTTEIAGNSSTKEKNKSGKGKRGRSREKEVDNSEEIIHVRAKRGQATDSHSIAERVRREKINQKMQCLQDLVPGCNKTMGMAVMLEEIINYVHSLQNQVEFLSMELAAACSSYDFNFGRESVKKEQGTNSHEAEEIEKWATERYGEQNGFHSTWPL